MLRQTPALPEACVKQAGMSHVGSDIPGLDEHRSHTTARRYTNSGAAREELRKTFQRTKTSTFSLWRHTTGSITF